MNDYPRFPIMLLKSDGTKSKPIKARFALCQDGTIRNAESITWKNLSGTITGFIIVFSKTARLEGPVDNPYTVTPSDKVSFMPYELSLELIE